MIKTYVAYIGRNPEFLDQHKALGLAGALRDAYPSSKEVRVIEAVALVMSVVLSYDRDTGVVAIQSWRKTLGLYRDCSDTYPRGRTK